MMMACATFVVQRSLDYTHSIYWARALHESEKMALKACIVEARFMASKLRYSQMTFIGW